MTNYREINKKLKNHRSVYFITQDLESFGMGDARFFKKERDSKRLKYFYMPSGHLGYLKDDVIDWWKKHRKEQRRIAANASLREKRRKIRAKAACAEAKVESNFWQRFRYFWLGF